MEFNNKKLTRTTKLVHYIISLALTIFLIGLANRIIWDMDSVKTPPVLTDFEPETEIRFYRVRRDSLDEEQRLTQEALKAIRLNIALQETLLDEKRTSFKSWISTRTATKSAAINNEIESRNRAMDSLQGIIKNFVAERILMNAQLEQLRAQSHKMDAQIENERSSAYKLLDKARFTYELHIFLSRLLFVLPILLLGVWMLLRTRKSSYWPLYRGFVFFSLYAFFIGLIPYLPSYGGYVRYTIGIILSLFVGIYAIRYLKAFVRRKKQELQQTSQERSKQIKDEVAEKALDNHICPSCGKDYLINELHQSSTKKRLEGNFKVTPFCRHCGLELFKDCDRCGTENYAHLPHCYSCGDHLMKSQSKSKNET